MGCSTMLATTLPKIFLYVINLSNKFLCLNRENHVKWGKGAGILNLDIDVLTLSYK